jgi:outer membrane murein-binding lipoprotein Lpp
VVIIELATGDVRAELDEAKAQISELNATVDALLVTNLEG